MNFIIRNLGWILLIIFFIFMLYLISSQNNVNNKNIINTGSISNLSLNDTKNISTEINVKEKIDQKIEKYNVEKLSNEVKIVKNEKGVIDGLREFFSLENKNSQIKKDNNLELDKEEVDEKLITKVDNEIKNIEKAENNNKKEEDNKKEAKDNSLNSESNIKNTENKDISEKIKEKIKIRNKNLIHTVGVKSIALNNPYFTKRIGYAYRGDKLEQLTNLNRYGCFNSEVIESKKSMGLKGWTCIYYMEGHLDEISKYQKQAIKYYKKLRQKRIAKKIVSNKIKIHNKTKTKKYPIYEKRADGSIIVIKDPHRVYEGPTYNTEVGSLYLVRVNSLKLNNETFTTKKGYLEACTTKNCDVLEQLTPVNEKGCFKVNVFMSKYNKNKRGWVCQKYLR